MAGANGSAIFTPFRAIGCCSNGVPLSLSPQKKSSWIATSVGKTFHIYECDKLHLLCIGPLQENDVTCLIQNRLLTYAAVSDQIKIFKFGKYFSSIESGRVRIMALLGQQLVAVDDQNHLNVWDITTKVLYTDISFDSNEFKITSLVHPTTHLNKVILGSHQGSLHLWNIRTSLHCEITMTLKAMNDKVSCSHLVYSFPGWGSPVLVLTQSPALDVLGIGLGDGSVLLHNIRTDELVMKFHQEWGPVTSLSFRTDGISVLASGSPSGHVTLWDLDERKLCSVMRETHSGSIAAVEYFPNLPLMITNGSDNAIKIWIFDESDGSGRLLKERCGHSAPPTMIRFHPTISRMIVSAGSDHTLRLVLLHNQTVTRELSQGSVHKKKRSHLIESRKLSNIIDFSCDWQHQNRWDGLVSVHHNSSTCYTWDLMNYSIGKHAIKSKYAANYRAKPNCCCMSGCGHLFIVGMNTGHVEIFNIQSGLHRGELVHDSHPAHQSCVRGIASSLYYIITAGADGLIKVWSFRLKTLLKVVELPSPVTRISFHKESELLGVACDNFQVHVVDVNNGRIVRTFAGHCGKITDICISPDSRWLITSSVDCSVRTWDIPTGHMIDIFTCETPPTSVTMSPTSNFLATTHIDELGIFLWANKTLYSTVSLKPIPVDYQPSMIQLPSTGNEPVPCDRTGETTIGSTTGNVTGSPLCEGLLTLSALPKSQWHSLLYIDIIKKRNKPKEPVQPMKPAPFFLPTQPGPDIKFIAPSEPVPEIEKSKSRILLDNVQASAFQRAVIDYSKNGKYSLVMDLLKGMGPAAIDLEFQLLTSENISIKELDIDNEDGHVTLLRGLITFLIEGLQSRNNFELIQSYIGLLLKHHTTFISTKLQLKPLIEQMLKEHEIVWKELMNQFNFCSTMVAYCKSATV